MFLVLHSIAFHTDFLHFCPT